MNSILGFELSNELISTGVSPLSQFNPMQYIAVVALVPIFIVNLRKLYVRDLQGRCGNDIDTVFGLQSVSSHSAAISAIMFAGAGQIEGKEESEEIRVEDTEICSVSSGV